MSHEQDVRCTVGLHVDPKYSVGDDNYYCSVCKQGMGQAYYHVRKQLDQQKQTLELHNMFMGQLQEAADKSTWIPKEYAVNDWIADCCSFLQGEKRLQTDMSIRQLQVQLPWTTHYHRDFRASPMSHKDFGHALIHVIKACGKIASIVNDAEHGGTTFAPDDIDRYVADLVVCALRMATTCPGRQIDLQRAVEDRIENKNSVNLER